MIISHTSDIHLPLTFKPNISSLFNKRVIGYINHYSNRRNVHKLENIELILNDIKLKNKTGHTILSGDIVNLSLEEEFIKANEFLGKYFTKNNLSIIPGNHDAYVNIKYKNSLCHLTNYLDESAPLNQDSPFPYIKKIKNIALIGISTAVPSPPFMCWGRVSKEQLIKLEEILSSIEKENNFVLLFLHHPIHHYGAFNLKGLLNKEELIETISKFNIHLIIHGHLHREIHNSIEIKEVLVPCIGAPSGSRDKNSGLSYLEYQIDKINDKWNLKVYRRQYNFTDEIFESLILKKVSYD